MSNKDLMQRKADATPRGVGVMCGFFADRAKNAEIWDTDGKRYIDFAGGIGVLNTGHLHAKVQAAVAEQLSRFSHTCYQVVPYESYIRLAEQLNQLTPGQHAKKTALFTTGAEAVENAVKVARAATGRGGVIAFGGAFHGRTLLGMALTGKVVPYKVGFGPFPGDVYHAPTPTRCMAFRWRTRCAAWKSCSSTMSIPSASPPSFSSRCKAKAVSTMRPANGWCSCARSATNTAFC